MSAKDEIDLDEIIQEIRTKPTVPVWPHAGRAQGLTKSATYRALQRGEIEVLKFGQRYKAISAALRKRLGLEAVS